MHRVSRRLQVIARSALSPGAARVMLVAAALAGTTLFAASGPVPERAHAATFTVNVGPSSTNTFVDAVSGTSTTTIHVGDTVTWTWISGTHSSCSGGACPANTVDPWDSTIKSGGTFSRQFNTSGTFNYWCAVHGSAMTGVIVVQAAATATAAAPTNTPMAATSTPVIATSTAAAATSTPVAVATTTSATATSAAPTSPVLIAPAPTTPRGGAAGAATQTALPRAGSGTSGGGMGRGTWLAIAAAGSAIVAIAGVAGARLRRRMRH